MLYTIRKVGLALLALTLSLGLIELVLTYTQPMQYIVPVMDWTPEYGCISYPNSSIINAKPTQWKYTYTTNASRYRGPLLTQRVSENTTVIVLGDSNIFGWGLQDDETIPAQLQKKLGADFSVYNMGNGGWSLPQQVRRYLELAEPCSPDLVILHMASNDLNDQVYGINWVARAQDSKTITLHKTPSNASGTLRKLLSVDSIAYRSVLRSQVFMRCKTLLKKNLMRGYKDISTTSDGNTTLASQPTSAHKIPDAQVIIMNEQVNEQRYQKLITAFATHLQQRNIPLIFLTDTEDVYGYSKLKQTLSELEQKESLQHQPISQWFKTRTDYPPSPQGHQWGTEAAERLAQELAVLTQQHIAHDPSIN